MTREGIPPLDIDCIRVFAHYNDTANHKNLYSSNYIEIPIEMKEWDLKKKIEGTKFFSSKHPEFTDEDILEYEFSYANRLYSKKYSKYKKIPPNIKRNFLLTLFDVDMDTVKNEIIVDSKKYIPTIEDFEDARRKLLSDNKKENKKTVSIDDMLNVIENSLKESGCRLSQSWREVTKKNIEVWQQRKEQK